jgi:hypothetical protein
MDIVNRKSGIILLFLAERLCGWNNRIRTPRENP